MFKNKVESLENATEKKETFEIPRKKFHSKRKNNCDEKKETRNAQKRIFISNNDGHQKKSYFFFFCKTIKTKMKHK